MAAPRAARRTTACDLTSAAVAAAKLKHKVIVKRLTGTLTMDRVILEKHCNVLQNDDGKVLLDAFC